MSLQVHVINIPRIAHSWIDNPNNVVEQIREFSEENDFEVIVIGTLDELDNMVRNPDDDMIIINGHGEALPVPPSWEWLSFIKKISEHISERKWVFVSITGMPFWYWTSDENVNEIQYDGLNALLEIIEKTIARRLQAGWSNLTLFGRNLSVYFGVELQETKHIARLLEFSDPSIIRKSLYRIGPLSGISAVKIGNGFFIHCGLMAPSINTISGNANRNTDRFIALISILFTIGVKRSNNTATQLFTQYGSNEALLCDNIVIPLLRLMRFKQIINIHGIDEHGRDIVCYMNDNFGNRINIGVQVKATRIHNNKSQRNNIIEILSQINDAFMVPYMDTFSNTERQIHKMYVITSKHITSPAKTVIRGTYNNKRYVHFMEGDHLIEEWINHYVL